MSGDDTKQALRLIEGLNKLDTTILDEVLADDAIWEIPADTSRLSVAGTRNKAEFLDLIRGLKGFLPDGIVLSTVGVTAENGRVAVEANGRGATDDGYVYENRYHFLFEVRDGKVTSGKEFCDSLSVAAFFGHLAPRLGAASAV